MASTPSAIEKISARANVAILLAARIVALIENSGAAQTEVCSALGVVQAVLPTLGIPAVTDPDA